MTETGLKFKNNAYSEFNTCQKIFRSILFPSRSTGLDLNLQQRFRWVHFRISNEPIKNLLGRHMLRRLLHTYGGEIPSPEESLFKVIAQTLLLSNKNDKISQQPVGNILRFWSSQIYILWINCALFLSLDSLQVSLCSICIWASQSVCTGMSFSNFVQNLSSPCIEESKNKLEQPI